MAQASKPCILQVVKGALPESTLGESLVDCRDPLQYFRAKMFGITGWRRRSVLPACSLNHSDISPCL